MYEQCMSLYAGGSQKLRTFRGGGGVQEEIENAKPWMDEEGIKHYKLKASLHNQNP